VSYVRQPFDLMKEIGKLLIAFPVETLILSMRNKLGQLMCVGSHLSEIIHFEARLVVTYPR